MIARNPIIALTVPISPKSTLPGLGKLSSRLAEHSLKVFHYCRNRNIAYFTSRALNDFHSTFGNLLSHSDSKGDTDQIGILELHPRPLVPVIEDHVKSCRLEPFCNVLGGRLYGFILHVDRRHYDLKRSDGRRQPETVFVVPL